MKRQQIRVKLNLQEIPVSQNGLAYFAMCFYVEASKKRLLLTETQIWLERNLDMQNGSRSNDSQAT